MFYSSDLSVVFYCTHLEHIAGHTSTFVGENLIEILGNVSSPVTLY